jgi:hypothetical protein
VRGRYVVLSMMGCMSPTPVELDLKSYVVQTREARTCRRDIDIFFLIFFVCFWKVRANS